MSRLNNFLGDSPLRVVLKLAVISFLVGAVLVSIGLTPFDLLADFGAFLSGIFNIGFDTLRRFGQYIMIGAVIVVPVFLLMRIFQSRG